MLVFYLIITKNRTFSIKSIISIFIRSLVSCQSVMKYEDNICSLLSDLPRVAPNNGPPGLSVVSAPAPVVQRPDLGHPGSATPGSNISRIGSQQSISEGQNSASLRSTKSQRIRGASNNLRIRQIELRENHATVLS